MKFSPQRIGTLMLAGTSAFLAPLGQCPAESDEFDPSSAMHFEAPVIVGTYAFDLQRLVSTQTELGRHEATEIQRKVAEANARKYMAAQLRAQGVATSSKPEKSGDKTAKTLKTDAKSVRAAKAKLPRYVAVDTVKDERSVPGTKKVMMIWDTQSESLRNNDVYDVSNPPPIGSTAKFDTYSVPYVGNGSETPH